SRPTATLPAESQPAEEIGPRLVGEDRRRARGGAELSTVRGPADSDTPIGRELLRVERARSVAFVQPEDPRAPLAIREARHRGLWPGRGAHGRSVRAPTRNPLAVGSEAGRIDVLLAVALVDPGEISAVCEVV